MAETTVELIKVTGVGPYSVFAGQARYGFNKPVDASKFQKGHTYSVAVVMGTKGGKYISRVDNDLGGLTPDQPSASSLNPSFNQSPIPTPLYTPNGKKSDGLTKDEWAAKDRRIGRAGRIQAATVAVASHSSDLETLKANAVSLADWMEEYVNEVK